MTIFEILKDVITEKSGNLVNLPDFEKDFNPYMVARWLSMRKDLMDYAKWINKYNGKVSNENIYKFLLDNIPQSKNSFIKYIKKKKEPKDDL
jgi:hypothetical protein